MTGPEVIAMLLEYDVTLDEQLLRQRERMLDRAEALRVEREEWERRRAATQAAWRQKGGESEMR